MSCDSLFDNWTRVTCQMSCAIGSWRAEQQDLLFNRFLNAVEIKLVLDRFLCRWYAADVSRRGERWGTSPISMDGLVLASLERLIERRMGNDTEGAMSLVARKKRTMFMCPSCLNYIKNLKPSRDRFQANNLNKGLRHLFDNPIFSNKRDLAPDTYYLSLRHSDVHARWRRSNHVPFFRVLACFSQGVSWPFLH